MTNEPAVLSNFDPIAIGDEIAVLETEAQSLASALGQAGVLVLANEASLHRSGHNQLQQIGPDDSDPEGAPAPPNRRPRPLCISLTSDDDKGIAKTSALSQIDHMRSIANQLYALLHPRQPLWWQPGNAACREAPSEGPR